MYDFAIIGAGVSGLSLAWLLEASRLGGSILLLDGAHDEEQLRTLSFWAAGEIALEPLVRHGWRTLRVFDGERALSLPLAEYSYRTLFFSELQAATKARLARHPQHRIVQGRVHSIEHREDSVLIRVGEDSFSARWAFDSRFRRTDLQVDTRRWHSLRQRFHGWIVRTEEDVFDPGVAILLDFRAAGSHAADGTTFGYLLPFGAREALVEIVTIVTIGAQESTDSTGAPDSADLLRGYLERAHGITRFSIFAQESGTSPMTEQPFAEWEGGRVRRIGIPSGRLKPSTGYALTRILDEAAAIVRSLEEYGHPFLTPGGSVMYRWLDGVLLELWEHEPGRIPGVFAALFSRNPPDRVLRFLDERASFFDVLRLVASLPVAPFLRAAGRWFCRRVGIPVPRVLGAPGPRRVLPPHEPTSG